MRGVRTGGAHDHKVDCPSLSTPLVYVSRLQRQGQMDDVTLGVATCSCVRLRRDRGAGCGCWAACLVARVLLFAVRVFAL